MNFKSTENPSDLWMELHLGPQEKKCNQFCSLFLRLVRGWQDYKGQIQGFHQANMNLLSRQNCTCLPEVWFWPKIFVHHAGVAFFFLLNCTVLKDLWTNLFYRSEYKYMWGMAAGLRATEIPEKPSVLLLIQRSAWNITMATILTQWKEHAIICA